VLACVFVVPVLSPPWRGTAHRVIYGWILVALVVGRLLPQLSIIRGRWRLVWAWDRFHRLYRGRSSHRFGGAIVFLNAAVAIAVAVTFFVQYLMLITP